MKQRIFNRTIGATSLKRTIDIFHRSFCSQAPNFLFSSTLILHLSVGSYYRNLSTYASMCRFYLPIVYHSLILLRSNSHTPRTIKISMHITVDINLVRFVSYVSRLNREIHQQVRDRHGENGVPIQPKGCTTRCGRVFGTAIARVLKIPVTTPIDPLPREPSPF